MPPKRPPLLPQQKEETEEKINTKHKRRIP
jgi:hypothetical protein